jgi:hypothetical protein
MTDRALAGFDVSTFTHDAHARRISRRVWAGRDRDPRASWHPSRHGRVRPATHRRGLHGLAAVPVRTSGSAITVPETVRSIVQVCASREFAILADHTNPAEHWLRALAARAHPECGGPGVGAIGMCFTGGFVLAMAVEPAVLAPVASQPGLPAPITAERRAALGMNPADLGRLRERAKDGLSVLGFGSVTTRAAQPNASKRSPEPLVTRSSASRSTRRQAIRLASARRHTPC